GGRVGVIRARPAADRDPPSLAAGIRKEPRGVAAGGLAAHRSAETRLRDHAPCRLRARAGNDGRDGQTPRVRRRSRRRRAVSRAGDPLLAAWRARSLISAARKAATMVVLALLAATGALGAQDHVCTGNMVSAVPFPVGERLSFNAKYGIFNVGSAAMEVMGIDTVHN